MPSSGATSSRSGPSDEGGQSSSVQSGQVHLMAGERKALGSITVAAVDMDVDAQLIVRSGGGRGMHRAVLI